MAHLDMYTRESQQCGEFLETGDRPSSARAQGMTSNALHAQLSERAGRRRCFTSVGLDNMASSVDTVVFGRDLDGSDTMTDVRKSMVFKGAHGKTSKELEYGHSDVPAKRTGHTGVQAKALINGGDVVAASNERAPLYKGAYGRKSSCVEDHSASVQREKLLHPNASSSHMQRFISGDRAFTMQGKGSATERAAAAVDALHQDAAGSTSAALRGVRPTIEGEVDNQLQASRGGLALPRRGADHHPHTDATNNMGTLYDEDGSGHTDANRRLPPRSASMDALGATSTTIGLAKARRHKPLPHSVDKLAARYCQGALDGAAVCPMGCSVRDAAAGVGRFARDGPFARAAGQCSATLDHIRIDRQMDDAERMRRPTSEAKLSSLALHPRGEILGLIFGNESIGSPGRVHPAFMGAAGTVSQHKSPTSAKGAGKAHEMINVGEQREQRQDRPRRDSLAGAGAVTLAWSAAVEIDGTAGKASDTIHCEGGRPDAGQDGARARRSSVTTPSMAGADFAGDWQALPGASALHSAAPVEKRSVLAYEYAAGCSARRASFATAGIKALALADGGEGSGDQPIRAGNARADSSGVTSAVFGSATDANSIAAMATAMNTEQAGGAAAGKFSHELCAAASTPCQRRHSAVAGMSETDQVVFGRDLDRSADMPTVLELPEYSGSHGVDSASLGRAQHDRRPKRSSCSALRSEVDALVFGRDLDRSSEQKPYEQDEIFDCASGKGSIANNEAAYSIDRQGRKHFGSALQLSDVGTVVFDRAAVAAIGERPLVTGAEYADACGVASRVTHRKIIQDATRQGRRSWSCWGGASTEKLFGADVPVQEYTEGTLMAPQFAAPPSLPLHTYTTHGDTPHGTAAQQAPACSLPYSCTYTTCDETPREQSLPRETPREPAAWQPDEQTYDGSRDVQSLPTAESPLSRRESTRGGESEQRHMLDPAPSHRSYASRTPRSAREQRSFSRQISSRSGYDGGGELTETSGKPFTGLSSTFAAIVGSSRMCSTGGSASPQVGRLHLDDMFDAPSEPSVHSRATSLRQSSPRRRGQDSPRQSSPRRRGQDSPRSTPRSQPRPSSPRQLSPQNSAPKKLKPQPSKPKPQAQPIVRA